MKTKAAPRNFSGESRRWVPSRWSKQKVIRRLKRARRHLVENACRYGMDFTWNAAAAESCLLFDRIISELLTDDYRNVGLKRAAVIPMPEVKHRLRGARLSTAARAKSTRGLPDRVYVQRKPSGVLLKYPTSFK